MTRIMKVELRPSRIQALVRCLGLAVAFLVMSTPVFGQRMPGTGERGMALFGR